LHASQFAQNGVRLDYSSAWRGAHRDFCGERNRRGDCRLCPRLAKFRHANRETLPGYFNDPVPGLRRSRRATSDRRPGARPARRQSHGGGRSRATTRGDLLYSTLLKQGLAKGTYAQSTDDSLILVDCAITNAVRCVPPDNKPASHRDRNLSPIPDRADRGDAKIESRSHTGPDRA